MHSFLQDVRFALRQLRKSPGFSMVALFTLALGIGISTTMFGVFNAVLLRPLPFPNPERLVRILATQHDTVLGPSPLDVRDFAAQNHSFEGFAVYDVWPKNISLSGGSVSPEQMPVGLVSAEYFEVLSIKPLMGRLFKDEENRWGNHYEVLLGYSFWQSRLQADPSVLGKTIRINDEPYTIIGVMPAEIADWWGETGQDRVELWAPFTPYIGSGESVWSDASRGDRGYGAIARIKLGVSLRQASADLERIAGSLAQQYPLDRGIGVALQPLQEDRIGDLHPVMLLLMGAVILILLIACSNVANLLLARNSGRTREIAVRVAMGAETSSLVWQFMTENLVLGLLGGFLGCALAWWGCVTIARIHPAQLPQLGEVRIDFRVLGFSFALSVLSSLIFGSIPVWSSVKVNLSEAFKESGRTNITSKRKKYLGRLFVVSEMAFAVMLLVGTGLLIQSLIRLQNQHTGFRVDHLLRTRLFLPAVRYSNPASITRFSDDYTARIRALPGVVDAAISGGYPPDDQWMQNFTIVGRPLSRIEDTPSAARNVVDTHYLHTLGVPLLEGRTFSESDTENAPPVALVNQAFVDYYFPAEDPVGKQILLGEPQRMAASASTFARFTIVGVIGNMTNRGLALPPLPHITTLFRQTPDLNSNFKNLIVRTALDPLQLAMPIRQQLHAIDPDLPLAEISTMDEIMQRQTADRRYTTELLALFACFGVALALIGVYGVVSYVVAQRTSEIGLRMALGARRADVLWLILKQGAGMSSVGAAAGLFGAWILRPGMARVVFGISSVDPATFLAAAFLLIAFAASASYIPARRASRVDPLIALRYE